MGLLLSGCGGSGSSLAPASSNALPASRALQEDVAQTSVVTQSPYVRNMPDGTVLHVYPLPADAKAYAAAHPSASMDVNYHGGRVLDESTAYAIYWQPDGFFMSPKYETVIDQFFHDIGSTAMYDILPQYRDTDGVPRNISHFGGGFVDITPYPLHMNDASIRDEVRHAIALNGWPKGGYDAIFFVFTASKAKDAFAYCAYHSDFSMSGKPVVYSIVPYQRDLGPHGCGTPSEVFPNDRDADLTIDTLWHEMAESISDPVDAWFRNSDGSEIADICQNDYGPLAPDGSDVALRNGHHYVTQEIWSNAGTACLQTFPGS
jgi:hypothetical protein